MYSLNVNTVTNAQRGVKILKRYGIYATIGRAKSSVRLKGCGYTVNFEYNDLDFVLNLFNTSGIDVLGVDVI